ncbi:hypothetical protein [Campylobacter sp. US33a]|uniref:hypothetical protein n=1 Tax=Campylobacter sp. US33a TaxID=2498120 RepID=UPI0010687A46|nr:hypothetical protein [Campylobacter sp. US33a]TEY00713.1 hypothetical protein ELQ16_08750 [Campylobacter sp. US33a]
MAMFNQIKKKNLDNKDKKPSLFKNKKILIAGGVFILILFLSLLLVLGKSNKEKDIETMSKNIAQQQEMNTTNVAPPPPPKLEFNMDKIKKDMLEANKSQEVELKKPQFDDENVSLNNSQKQMIEELSKNDGINIDGSKLEIKPEDMIVYLKAKKETLIFNPLNDYFSFDGRTYKSGDVFKGWWIIEEINENFIRFIDEENGYAYNLRFI